MTISNSVTTIDYNAFNACSSLTSVNIPNSVTIIGASTFSGCNSLTSVTIGTGITKIEEKAFYWLTNMNSITIYATTPPTLEEDALYTNSCPIYVPSESVNAYKTAGGYWSSYSSRIQAIQ